MKQLRTEPFTKLPLSEVGERLSMAQIERRIAAHLKNLRVDVPVLNYLWSSVLTWELEAADRRMWLIVSLAEVVQSRLDLVGQTSRVKTDDPFLDDVSDVRRLVGNVKWRTLLAMSAAASPLDGSSDDESSASTASVRQRVKRGAKGGKLQLAGWPEPQQLDIDDLPGILPQGAEAEISAEVLWLDHESAGLLRVRIEEQPKAGPTLTVDEGKEALLGRAGHFARAEHGTLLQVAMDNGKRIRLKVIAHLDWASAEVVGFELRDIQVPK